MRQNNGNTALTLPPLLVIATVALLCFRLYLNATEKPELLPSAIHWNTNGQQIKAGLKGDPLLFYYFSAEWCESCNVLEQTAFRDKTVVSMLNTEFVPIKVIDPSAGTPIKQKQAVESLEHQYNISAFPSFIVILRDGTWVNSHLGNTSARNLVSFLKACEKKAGLTRALRNFTLEPQQSASRLEEWLKTCNWSEEDAVFASAYAALAYRLCKNDSAANRILLTADSNIHNRFYDLWPKPLLKYLKGEIESKKLFEDIEYDRAALATAKFFVAMDLKSKGKDKESIEMLKWVYASGEHDTGAFALAAQELRRGQTKESSADDKQ